MAYGVVASGGRGECEARFHGVAYAPRKRAGTGVAASRLKRVYGLKASKPRAALIVSFRSRCTSYTCAVLRDLDGGRTKCLQLGDHATPSTDLVRGHHDHHIAAANHFNNYSDAAPPSLSLEARPWMSPLGLSWASPLPATGPEVLRLSQALRKQASGLQSIDRYENLGIVGKVAASYI